MSRTEKYHSLPADSDEEAAATEDPSNVAAPPSASKSKSKILIAAIAFLVVVLAAGGATYYFMNRSPSSSASNSPLATSPASANVLASSSSPPASSATPTSSLSSPGAIGGAMKNDTLALHELGKVVGANHHDPESSSPDSSAAPGKESGNRGKTGYIAPSDDENDDDDDDSEEEGSHGSGPSSTNTASRPSGTSHSNPPSTNSTSGSLPALTGTYLVDFTTLKSPSELPAFLKAHKLSISTDHVGTTPISHTFLRENVDWLDGAMRLKVTGQQGRGDVKSAEVGTDEEILFGKVTTRMKLTPVEGVCQSEFYYKDDQHEVDIELLSSYYTKGLENGVLAGAEFTNQPLKGGGPSKESNKVAPFTFDPTADFHDYTIEWTKEATIFSLDHKVVATINENVPSTPMNMVWNNWSSGEPEWSAGPPKEDAYLLISMIAADWTVAK